MYPLTKMRAWSKAWKRPHFKERPPEERQVSRTPLVPQEELQSDGELSFEESDDNGEFDYEDYEKMPRNNLDKLKVRDLLPIKSKKGLQYRSVIEPDEKIDDQETKKIKSVGPKKVIKKPSFVQHYALQHKTLDNLKTEVAMLCTSIISAPEDHMKILQRLIMRLKTPSSVLIVSEKTIISLSLLHVFIDICPEYTIRPKEETEGVKFKKETKAILNYEQTLLTYYKKYIDCLHNMAREMKSKKLGNLSVAKKNAVRKVGLIGIKCLCGLLSTHFRFNYFKVLLDYLMSYVSSKDKEVTAMCCEAFKKVFEADLLGEPSLEIVRAIQKFTKDHNFIIPVDVIDSFQSLNLKESEPENAGEIKKKKIDMKKIRREVSAMTNKERYLNKKRHMLQRELNETEANEDAKSVSRFHTKTLNKVFWIYFHVLKDCKKVSLISPVLKGFSHFSYLINLNFFSDLYSVMCGVMENGHLSDIEKLQCVNTLFSILAGQAESLSIDIHKIYLYMYDIMLRLCEARFQDDSRFDLTLRCIHRMILRKRKSITFNRMMAFVKRLSIVSVHVPLHGTLAFLSLLRELLLNIKGSDLLLDVESMMGNGVYLPEHEDPEYCNAHTALLWELHLLKNHYHPIIQSYSQHILHGCPKQGSFSLPLELEQSNPLATLSFLADVSASHNIQGFEEMEEPPKKKMRISDVPNPVLKEIPCKLSWEDMNDVDFVQSLLLKEDAE